MFSVEKNILLLDQSKYIRLVFLNREIVSEISVKFMCFRHFSKI
jgi:hypothetical protein